MGGSHLPESKIIPRPGSLSAAGASLRLPVPDFGKPNVVARAKWLAAYVRRATSWKRFDLEHRDRRPR